jgi:hypothetical protein
MENQMRRLLIATTLGLGLLAGGGMASSSIAIPLAGNTATHAMDQRALVTPVHDNAPAAFVVRKSGIDAILARLVRLSAEHFDRTPDDITWADVGTVGGYLEGLRRVTDAAFHEGEHAA